MAERLRDRLQHGQRALGLWHGYGSVHAGAWLSHRLALWPKSSAVRSGRLMDRSGPVARGAGSSIEGSPPMGTPGLAYPGGIGCQSASSSTDVLVVTWNRPLPSGFIVHG